MAESETVIAFRVRDEVIVHEMLGHVFFVANLHFSICGPNQCRAVVIHGENVWLKHPVALALVPAVCFKPKFRPLDSVRGFRLHAVFCFLNLRFPGVVALLF